MAVFIVAATLSVQVAIKNPDRSQSIRDMLCSSFSYQSKEKNFFHGSLLTNEKWTILSRELFRDAYKSLDGNEPLSGIYIRTHLKNTDGGLGQGI